MRSYLSYIVAPVALILSLMLAGSGAMPTTVTLPIEVYPLDGHSVTTESIVVEASDVSQVDSLYFKMHQPYYHVGGNRKIDEIDGFDPEGAVSIRVNGSSWIDVRNENVTCALMEEMRWCVGGTSPTLRFTIPASSFGSLTNGQNTIDFRWNGSDEIRTGFRVLAVGFMTPADPDVEDFDAYTGDYNGDGVADGAIDGTTWQWDDPASWTAPAGADAANGQVLWSQRDLLLDGDGSQITAACADCHFRGGEDLKYFNFSNEVIAARSTFHGLTQAQGQDIAAYIRSHVLTTRDGTQYDAPGSPWDPPFQPGPQMLGSDLAHDEGDPVYWMAGAGLRWVLDREREVPNTDRDMLAHIFPDNGDPANGVDYLTSGPYAGDLNWHHIHMDSTLNFKGIPIDQQFPDWNNWIPDMHPIDYLQDFENSATGQQLYTEFFPNLDENSGMDEYRREVSRYRSDFMFTDAVNGGKLGTSKQGLPYSLSNPTDNEIALTRLSSEQHRTMILMDEAFNNNSWHVAGRDNCGTSLNPDISYCEAVALPGGTETVFRIGPHVNGTLPYPQTPGTERFAGYGNREKSADMTHLWYHAAVVTDPAAYDINSIDWNYQNAFLEDDLFPLRSLTNYAYSAQYRSGPRGNDYGNFGWSYGGWKPDNYYRGTIGNTWSEGYKATTAYMSTETMGKMQEAWHRSWFQHTNSYPVDSYPRDAVTDVRTFDDESFGPNYTSYPPPFQYRTRYYDAWTSLASNHSPEMGGIIDSMTTWAGEMWPLGNDPAYMNQEGTQYALWSEIVTGYTPPTVDSIRAFTPREEGIGGRARRQTDRWRVEVKFGAPGSLTERWGLSDSQQETVADGQTCAFTIDNIERVDEFTSEVDTLSYHDGVFHCVNQDVCLRYFAEGRSVQFMNVQTGMVSGQIRGTITQPISSSITCTGATCTGSASGQTVGSMTDTTPLGGGTCSVYGAMGEQEDLQRLAFDVIPTN